MPARLGPLILPLMKDEVGRNWRLERIGQSKDIRRNWMSDQATRILHERSSKHGPQLNYQIIDLPVHPQVPEALGKLKLHCHDAQLPLSCTIISVVWEGGAIPVP